MKYILINTEYIVVVEDDKVKETCDLIYLANSEADITICDEIEEAYSYARTILSFKLPEIIEL